jgi:tetratricopeptide (TPR) repeat protein
MHPGKIMLLGALLLAVLIVLFIFYSHYRDELEKEAAYQGLVEEGFVFLEDSEKEENVDEAIKLGLRARDLDPGGESALLLIARAYVEKKLFKNLIETLEAEIEKMQDLDFYPEYNYYLGLAYSHLFRDLGQEELFNKAMQCFTESASSPFHRPDAYFGMGTLYFSRYQENRTPYLKEKVGLNFQRCIDIEADCIGYVEDQPDSPCPLCRKPFRKKMDNPDFAKLMDALTK